MHEPCLLYIHFIPWPNGNVADRRFLIRSHASLSCEVVVCYLKTSAIMFPGIQFVRRSESLA